LRKTELKSPGDNGGWEGGTRNLLRELKDLGNGKSGKELLVEDKYKKKKLSLNIRERGRGLSNKGVPES